MPGRYPVPPRSWTGSSEEHIRKVALAVEGLQKGHSNNAIVVTLTPGATETVVASGIDYVSPGTVAFLQPKSASAAQATGLWTETANGQVTIHHDADAADDREFAIIFIG